MRIVILTMQRNDPCWCGSGSKWKKCHYPQPQPAAGSPSEELRQRYLKKYGIYIKNRQQIDGIRRACGVTAAILDELCRAAVAGVTTQELDDLAVALHKQHNAIAAPLHYGRPPFPKSICTSVNEVICHGIPDKVPLRDGDIMNIDVSAIVDGYYGDCSKMVTIGAVSRERQLVVDVAYECLMRSIAVLKPGVALCEIGEVIESYAEARGCSVVNQFVGHGVGVKFHEGPQIFHNRNHSKITLVEGMTFTIEPMINAGLREAVIDESNMWVARTIDGKPSAQWEHTVLITSHGHEILTPWQR